MYKFLLSSVLACIYSIFYTILGPMMLSQKMGTDRSMIRPFLMCFVIGFLINLFIFSVEKKVSITAKKGRLSALFDKIGDRRLFFVIWGLIFVSWIPAFLIFYPGILSYDIISQVASAFGGITDNHHPVLHTWLLKEFLTLGNSLFSSYEAGIGLLSVIQMIILSYAMARVVLLLRKYGISDLIILIVTLLSSFWFLNACMSVSMVKDTLHGAFLLLFICHFTEISLDPEHYIRKKINFASLPLVSFLMCAFRNNGLHIYIFCFAILFILRLGSIAKVRKYIALIAVILLPVVLYKVYSGPVFSALGIAQGQVREALSVPIQQLQRVAVLHWDELSTEDQERLGSYIDGLEWRGDGSGRLYEPFNADPAKGCFYSNTYNASPMTFWKFWAKMGIRFSKEYITAFLSNTLGYWYPGFYGYSYVMYENYPPEVFPVPLEGKSHLNPSALHSAYASLCQNDIWRRLPAVRLFFVPAFAPWVLLYALILSRKKKGWFTHTLPIFLPLIAQLGIMFMCPISSFRYSWPFFIMLPVLLIGLKNEKD